MELQTQVPKISPGIKNQKGWEKTMQQMLPKYFSVFFSAQIYLRIPHKSSRSAYLGEKGKSFSRGAGGMQVNRDQCCASLERSVCQWGALAVLPWNNHHGVLCRAATLHVLLPWQPVPFCILWWIWGVYVSTEEPGLYIECIPGREPGAWSRERLCVCTGRVAGTGVLLSALKTEMIWSGSCGGPDTVIFSPLLLPQACLNS